MLFNKGSLCGKILYSHGSSKFMSLTDIGIASTSKLETLPLTIQAYYLCEYFNLMKFFETS